MEANQMDEGAASVAKSAQSDAKRHKVDELDKKIAEMVDDIKAKGAQIEVVGREIRTLSQRLIDAKPDEKDDIKTAIAEAKAQQAELKAQQAKLEAQQEELKKQRDDAKKEREEARAQRGVAQLTSAFSLSAAAAPRPLPSTRVAELLAKVEFPSRAKTMEFLKSATLEEGNMHAGAQRKVKADPVSLAPSLALDALDRRVKEYGVSLGRLETRGEPYGLVMLGPSGCGKTRKILQFLAKNVGYFVPHKTPGDGKYGSEALAAVLDTVVVGAQALTSDQKDVDVGALDRLRERVQFGVKCVLVAYQAVYEAWYKASGQKDEQEGASAWLLLQLFPTKILQDDVFKIIALELVQFYDKFSLRVDVKARPCFVDEAQVISKRGLFLRSTVVQRSSFRTLLSAVIEGVNNVMGVSPILAGTGFSIALEKQTLVSQMGVGGTAEWAYLDFPPLSPAEVKTMLTTRLNVAGQRRVDEAAHWLAGRPRFAARFVEELLLSGGSLDANLDQYLAGLWSPPLTPLSEKATPRTPGEAFYALGKRAPLEQVPWRSTNTEEDSFGGTYDEGIQEAFFLTVGLPPQVRENALLSELDIAYVANVVAADRPVQTVVKLEPLVLEAATRHIAKYTPGFFLRRVFAHEENASSMGDAFEYVVAFNVLPKWFPPSGVAPASSSSSAPAVAVPRFEDSVVMRLPRNQNWRRAVAGPDVVAPQALDVAALSSLAAAFEGPWIPARPSCFGRVAGTGSKAEAYEWLRASLPGWTWAERPPAGDPAGWVPSLFFPDVEAGGDIYLVLRRPDDLAQVMLVIVQVKLVKGALVDGSMGGPDTRDALLTTDPSLIHVHNRGGGDRKAATAPASSASPSGLVAAVKSLAGGSKQGSKSKAGKVASGAGAVAAAAAPGTERPIAAVSAERAEFFAALNDVPVVRVLVSGACAVSRAETGFVANGRGGRISHDLQVIVDKDDLAAEGLLGEGVVRKLAALKGLE